MHEDLALAVFRVCVGAVFVAHGCNHVFGGGKIAGTARWFAGLGMRPGLLAALVAGAGGAAVLLAMFWRPARR
jgi:putative oxidoreductase